MQVQPSIALVFLNYNGEEYLKQNLSFVKDIAYANKKVYVIDNNSHDGSVNYLQLNHPDVFLIGNTRNFGYAAAYNKTLAKIEADYFFLLNTDVEITSNFIEPIISLMESDKTIGICQPKILSIAQKSHFEYAGGAGGWIDILGYTFTRGRVFDNYEEDVAQYDNNCQIFWASGACMVIRSSVFKKLKGFYEYFFMYCEEVDLCWRAWAEGYKVVFCSEAVIYHRETDSLLDQSPKRLYYLFRNNLIMLHSNLSLSVAIWTLPARLLLNLVSIFYFIAKGKFKISILTAVAQLDYLKWALLEKKDPRHKKKLPLSKIASVYKGCIVYQYFILGRKKFSDIVRIKI